MEQISPIHGTGYYYTGNGVRLEPRDFSLRQVGPQEVVVEVAGAACAIPT